MIDTFDSAIAAGYSMTGGTVYSRSYIGLAAAPAGDTSKFMAANGGNSATLRSAGGIESMSVYLGSLDTYNSITFIGAGGLDETLSGAQLLPFGLANGDQTNGATNRRFDFNFGTTPVNEVIFSSSGNSLEFDNIAVAPVPEPSTWAFAIAGVAAMGGLGWWRRRKSAGSPPHTSAVGA
jgi:hypothetical protein